MVTPADGHFHCCEALEERLELGQPELVRLSLVDGGDSATLGRPQAGCSGHGDPPRGSGGAPGCVRAASARAATKGKRMEWVL